MGFKSKAGVPILEGGRVTLGVDFQKGGKADLEGEWPLTPIPHAWVCLYSNSFERKSRSEHVHTYLVSINFTAQ